MGVGIIMTGLAGFFHLPAGHDGQGMSAYACCYDPPAAVIEPDSPPDSELDSPSDTPLDSPPVTEEAPIAEIPADSEMGVEEASDETTPPVTLFDAPLRAARAAIAVEEWLKADIIVNDALERLGTEPNLDALRGEINAYFGLMSAENTPISRQPPSRVGGLSPLQAQRNPLATTLTDFGAVRTPIP